MEDMTPFSGEERKKVINDLAEKTHRYGLTVPAIIVAEGIKPLAFIASQTVHFFSPFIDAMVGFGRTYRYGNLLENRQNLEDFMLRLEFLAKEEDRSRAAKQKQPRG